MSSPLHSAIPNSGISLNILIIGAGLAGLSTAITLSQTGHDVTVSPPPHAPKSRPLSDLRCGGAGANACAGAREVREQEGGGVYDCHGLERDACA